MSSQAKDVKAVRSDSALSLIHAMQVADSIRQHFKKEKENTKDSSSSIPPGLLQGVAAFGFAGVALLPVRRVLLRQASGNDAFRHFMDLVASVGHALAATQVGLIAGSLYGGNSYLQEFAQVSPNAENAAADRICESMWTNLLPPHLLAPTSSIADNIASSTSWDPREQTMYSLHQAIENCRRRRDFVESNTNYS